jgi:putative membrane protein
MNANNPPLIHPSPRELGLYAAIALAVLIWSGIGPTDRLTWFMEVVWVLIALPLIGATWSRFPLTRLLCVLILAHMILLMVGGHYTYAEVPAGFWARDWLDLERNHYDRLGHFAQGFVPAILAREMLLRHTALRRGGWLFYLIASVCLAFSAFFEMIEWWAALIWGADADAFLATQGDPWDTQWDMFLALIGAISAQLLLSRWHDRQLGPAITR